LEQGGDESALGDPRVLIGDHRLKPQRPGKSPAKLAQQGDDPARHRIGVVADPDAVVEVEVHDRLGRHPRVMQERQGVVAAELDRPPAAGGEMGTQVTERRRVAHADPRRPREQLVRDAARSHGGFVDLQARGNEREAPPPGQPFRRGDVVGLAPAPILVEESASVDVDDRALGGDLPRELEEVVFDVPLAVLIVHVGGVSELSRVAVQEDAMVPMHLPLDDHHRQWRAWGASDRLDRGGELKDVTVVPRTVVAPD
jgi:hypothetical protein